MKVYNYSEAYLAARQRPGTWQRMTREAVDYARGVVPPWYVGGLFGVGEPYCHDDNGKPMTLWVDPIRCRAIFGTAREAEEAHRHVLALDDARWERMEYLTGIRE